MTKLQSLRLVLGLMNILFGGLQILYGLANTESYRWYVMGAIVIFCGIVAIASVRFRFGGTKWIITEQHLAKLAQTGNITIVGQPIR